MENISKKIFTNKAISFASFFGGPIAAGIIISKNYKAFGNDTAARNSIFIGILSTILMFAGIYMIPENITDKIPQQLLPLFYTPIIAGVVEKLQGQKIRNFLANGGEKASNWQLAAYGFLGLVITCIFFYAMFFSGPMQGYEKSIKIDKNINLHYSKIMDKTTSQRVAMTIKESGFMQGIESADLFFSKESTHYKLKFVLTDLKILSDTLVISDFTSFEYYLNYNLKLDQGIEIGFTDIFLKEEYVLPEIDLPELKIYEPLLYLQVYKLNEFHTIYYNTDTPVEDVKRVADAVIRLKAYFPVNQTIDIVFLNNGQYYTIKFFISKELWYDPAVTDRLKSTVEYIKNNGILKDIKLVLIDNQTLEERSL